MTMHLVPVAGPPGAGKTSTLSEVCRRSVRVARFGVRDYGLKLAHVGNPFGLRMRKTLREGRLLPDEVVRDEFVHFLGSLGEGIDVIAVEGYPRDEAQCRDLVRTADRLGLAIRAYVLLDIPDSLVSHRVRDRYFCDSCGRQPTAPRTTSCSWCASPLRLRSDDDPPRLARRVAEFRRGVAGPVSFFRRESLLHQLDGTKSFNQVRAELENILGVVPDGRMEHVS
jgi:adenylate kinase